MLHMRIFLKVRLRDVATMLDQVEIGNRLLHIRQKRLSKLKLLRPQNPHGMSLV